MKELVSAISVGKVNDTVIVDLDYNEEAWDGEVADIPAAMLPSTGEMSLLQMDGKITEEQLAEALGTVKDACMKINEVQREALRKKYEDIEKDIESSSPIDAKAKQKMVADAEDVPVEDSKEESDTEETEAVETDGDDDE